MATDWLQRARDANAVNAVTTGGVFDGADGALAVNAVPSQAILAPDSSKKERKNPEKSTLERIAFAVPGNTGSDGTVITADALPAAGSVGVKTPSDGTAFTAFAPEHRAVINRWLDRIGEHNASERAAVLAKCDADPQVRADVVELVMHALSKHHSPAR